MKVTIHKIASLFLSFALVVTSINVLPADTVIKKVKAEEIKVNLDNVTVDADIVNGGDVDEELKNAEDQLNFEMGN